MYPLRPSGVKIGELKTRLSVPTADAVPRPNVLSPQMIDYVGMLSLLGVGMECIIIFKDVYNKPLEEIFGRELSESELLSIIQLEPKFPPQLNTLINAYKNPRVKFINTEYWLNSGFISTYEENLIYSLFK